VRRVDHACFVFSSVLLEGVDGDFGTFPDGMDEFDLRRRRKSSYPSLISRNRSTRTSKSMASGASKSNSDLNACADCSGVRGL
jgi:hypothetical protein